ncbi:group II truncated hemoglobin [Pontiella sulfatireligans]|uniref:Group 2 truncated hemoglobin YjbI n=1 Tax=Pontiella sulfatireligans TaxID=2750658 RepID=A0A6C2ULK9_9BACT|nr:group II truncated hemoglobin [Pontiella sulfatireligans]VGO20307.1 Group 2 truncated hemoglobin YjbI [Pontiella sulfatireligans]
MSHDLETLYESYRTGDNQFQLAGGVEGITKLANDFYDQMTTLPEARRILHMHPTDLTESREKLARFLCGYMNGPELYEEKYGPIQLTPAHAHLAIGTTEKEAWLLCMRKAMDLQPYPQEFKDFIMKRLEIPAGRCQNRP